jgi:molybdopterin/thiamine biosynthesis adenylyltransferase
MTDRSKYFARARERVDEPLLREKLVLIVGVGSVGSQIAELLAKSGVGRLVLVDGEALDERNLLRHALTQGSVGVNKAVATAAMLRKEVPDLDIRGVDRDVDASMPDGELDRLIAPADLLVATTDRVEVQRRLARRALAVITLAILPGVYPERGGEVFVQRQPGRECYHCYDAFRDPSQRLREAGGINLDVLLIVQLAVRLSLGLLDPTSRYARLLHRWEPPYPPLPTLFIQRPTHIELPVVDRRAGCPSCGAPVRDPVQAHSESGGLDAPRARPATAGRPTPTAPTQQSTPQSSQAPPRARHPRAWLFGLAATAVGVIVAVSVSSGGSASIPLGGEATAYRCESYQFGAAGHSYDGFDARERILADRPRLRLYEANVSSPTNYYVWIVARLVGRGEMLWCRVISKPAIWVDSTEAPQNTIDASGGSIHVSIRTGARECVLHLTIGAWRGQLTRQAMTGEEVDAGRPCRLSDVLDAQDGADLATVARLPLRGMILRT